MGVILPSNKGAMIASGIGMAASLAATFLCTNRVNNVSANGTTMLLNTIDSSGGDRGGYTSMSPLRVSKFADDAQPFSVEPIKTCDTAAAFNGELVSYGGVTEFKVSFSVIPFSEDDKLLSRLVLDSLYDQELYIDMTIYYVRPKKVTPLLGMFDEKTETVPIRLRYGRLESGAISPSASDARLTGKTYSIVFAAGLRSNIFIDNPIDGDVGGSLSSSGGFGW